MGKWTDRGFEAQTLSSYKAQLQQAFKNAFGPDFLIDDALPQGVLIQELAEILYNADMDGIEALSRMNINTASGIYLDLIGGMRGIRRSAGTPQIATVEITCNSTNFTPFLIDAGTVFTVSGSGERFVLPVSHVVSSTTDILSLEYEQSGDSTSNVDDVMSVDNYAQITDIKITSLVPGAGREEDYLYRRRLTSEYPVSSGTVEFVQNKIFETGLVEDTGFDANDTAETTLSGIPPYCTEWMAVPKEGVSTNAFEQAVGSAIVNNKVPGMPTYGNTTVTVTDVFGQQKTVMFTVPVKKEVEISVQVGTPEGTGVLNLANVEDIKLSIKDYINSLRIGKDVSYTRCMKFLVNEDDFEVLSFKIRFKGDEDWILNNSLTIGNREYARIASADINIGI